ARRRSRKSLPNSREPASSRLPRNRPKPGSQRSKVGVAMSQTQPVFLWTLKARRRFRSNLAHTDSPEAIMQRIEQILTQAFPGASVVIQDKMFGFRRRPDLHILLVEVCGGTAPGAYVVKIGPVDKLQKEIDGWQSCCPYGLHHDIVFL